MLLVHPCDIWQCPPQQFCNPQQICNPPQQFYNPSQQFLNPPQRFCNPLQRFCNPTQQLCNPPQQQQQFSYEVPGYTHQQSAAQINTLMNSPQLDPNGQILPLQSAFSSLGIQSAFGSLGISDDNPQNNCNGVNDSLLFYTMSSNYG